MGLAPRKIGGESIGNLDWNMYSRSDGKQTKEYKERHKKEIDPKYGMVSLFD